MFHEHTPRIKSDIGKRILATLSNHPVVYVIVGGMDDEIVAEFTEYAATLNADAPVIVSDVDATRTYSNVGNAATKQKKNIVRTKFTDESDSFVVAYRVNVTGTTA